MKKCLLLALFIACNSVALGKPKGKRSHSFGEKILVGIQVGGYSLSAASLGHQFHTQDFSWKRTAITAGLFGAGATSTGWWWYLRNHDYSTMPRFTPFLSTRIERGKESYKYSIQLRNGATILFNKRNSVAEETNGEVTTTNVASESRTLIKGYTADSFDENTEYYYKEGRIFSKNDVEILPIQESTTDNRVNGREK